MKLIIFYPAGSTSSIFGYSSSIRMAYLLNGYVATAGLNKYLHFLKDNLKDFTLDLRIKYLKDLCTSEEVLDFVGIYEREMKAINKLKSKSSQVMVYLAKAKKKINFYFDDFVNHQEHVFNQLFYVNAMKELINPDVFYFYPMHEADITEDSKTITSAVALLQLLLPDPEREFPLFFLDMHKQNNELLDVPIHLPESENAEDPQNFYGHRSFIFPKLTGLSSIQIRSARNQMTELTGEFRKKIDQWSAICYKNPNSNEGLEFFRSEVMEILTSVKDKALETPILKNISALTTQKDQSQLIIGQLPIEKLWSVYKDTNAISEDDYNELMKIKAEQFPKYEGRWPVIFCTVLPDSINHRPNSDGEIVLSLKKNISVD